MRVTKILRLSQNFFIYYYVLRQKWCKINYITYIWEEITCSLTVILTGLYCLMI